MTYNSKEVKAFWELVVLLLVLVGLGRLAWNNVEIVAKVFGMIMFAGVVWACVMAALVPANKTYQGSPPTPEETK